jgi:hypothetical protein
LVHKDQGSGQNGPAALSLLYTGLQRRLTGLRLFTRSIIWSREVKYLEITFDVKLLSNKNIHKAAYKTLAEISELYSWDTIASFCPSSNSNYT